jgi:hypothetical protein
VMTSIDTSSSDLSQVLSSVILGFSGSLIWSFITGIIISRSSGIASLIILSIMSIINSGLAGLLNLLGLWFWSGSYIAIAIGGTTGSIVGAGCAIFVRLWD